VLVEAPGECPSQTAEAGRAKACEGCPGQKLCQNESGVADPYKASLALRMNAIANKILVLSGKGGVGKSSVASLLALAMDDKGKRVGLLDVDICGPSIPKLMNLEGQQIVNSPQGWTPLRPPSHKIVVMSIGFMLETPNTPVVWRGPRKTAIIKRFLADTFWGRLDYLFVDTPPGTSDEHLSIVTELSRTKPDGCVIVTTPQQVSLDTIRKEISFCEKMKLPILGIIENMSGFVCPCCQEVTDIWGSSGAGQKIAEEYALPFLGKIPLDPTLGNNAETGSCLFCNSPDSASTHAIRNIVNALCDEMAARKNI